MMMKRFAAVMVLFPAVCFADPQAGEPDDKFLTACSPTAYVKPDEALPKPDKIIPSGKMALPAGKSKYAPGQRVYLSGKVVDEDCVPVSDAIVEIWQADARGSYAKASLGERLNPYPTFNNTGRAVTDNLGRFKFLTLFPGLGKEAAPHIHVRVTHKNFKLLETEMYFGKDERNPAEERFTKLSPVQQDSITAKVWLRNEENPEAGINARWNITLPGKNRYRHY